jgi:PHP domain
MHELIINLHMHTVYSDGHVLHSDIAQAALRAGIDAVIVTDHNVYVDGLEDYYKDGDRQVLLLVGEEIHDQARQPQKNHLLVFGAGRELSTLAWDPQRLLDSVRQAGGLSFIAHPVDPAAPAVHEDDISWVDWQVQGYTGIELWNGMSEFKSLLKSRLHGLYYALRPQRIAHGPFPEALHKWDDLLAAGQRIVAIGGSDAHAFQASLGPIRRTLFPYEWHFRTINTHLVVERPLSGVLESDRRMILQALKSGRAFIGYDLAAPTRGFRFTAHGFEQTATLGEEISAQRGVTLQIRLPRPAFCRLIRDGEIVQVWEKQESCMHITTSPGAYRVEAHIEYQGQRRGWIFSNPIYIRRNG